MPLAYASIRVTRLPMQPGMQHHAETPEEKRRLILSLARPTAFIPLSRAILGRMGYSIVPLDEWQASPPLSKREPALCLVDDRMLGSLPEEAPFERLPILLLTGREPRATDDRRVIGAIPQPAGLHELYRLLQQVLEPMPRGALRVPTNLPARMRGADREWIGSVLSLSENGCLLRTPEPLPLGTSLEISFELPRAGRIETRAEASYQLIPDFGLVFQSTPAASRNAIRSFVEQHLAAA
ncbi:MAG: PilZ domain-containing protein [Deltaproteobacteria bacterium]|nr:PilZ domain-containing protein [Deltaproteobacteria bacterium]